MKLRYGAVVVAGVVLSVGVSAASASAVSSTAPGQAKKAFVGPLVNTTTIHSTVPANGDQNPYGVAVVPLTQGDLVQGNVLVSNFNDGSNRQGRGTTIMQVSPDGTAATVFADVAQPLAMKSCPGGGIGLTTALVALQSGWVIVGSLPTDINGALEPGVPGCLLVLDSMGTVQEVITGHGINGPWDMTALDQGSDVKLFVTNVLNGDVASQPSSVVVNAGTVVRLDLDIEPSELPEVTDSTEIGSGFGEHTDPSALIVGPTGVGLADNGALYVADSVGNRIAVINNAAKRHNSAGTGRTFSADENLSTPLGLAVAPNGNVLTVNAGDGNLVETRSSGQIAVRLLDNTGSPPGAGNLFGLAVNASGPSVYYVDDAPTANSLNLLF